MIVMVLGVAALLTSARPWEINYSESQCRLSRAYESDKGSVVLSFADILAGSTPMTLNLFVPSQAGQSREEGTALISFDPMNATQHPSFVSTGLSGDKKRLLKTTVAVTPDMDLKAVTMLHVKAGAVDVTFAPGVTAGALTAFRTCTEDLRTRLGLSPEDAALIAEPAVGQDDWVSSDDYPKEALRERREGTVVLVLTVGTDGQVSECRAAVSSGTALLDATTCTLLSRRGRFKPALGKDGHWMTSHYVWQTNWRLPKF